ncbi:BspA family leucine-rich repeat surface protein [Ruminococcus sp.]|uniref:BspA family leucine-rich repeat surface protein n=1 Tax=Ruminococcus sp. TaxID=41978 RepID=UPI0025EB0834|nr:BspA family leucine-rich repeat surface protein [Ruminococcus sp.]
MKTKPIKKTTAAILALMITSGAVSIPGSDGTFFGNLFTVHADNESGCFFDEGTRTITLKGEVTKYDVSVALKAFNEDKIVADEGAVFPESCAGLFSYSTATSIDLSKADTRNVVYMSSMFNSCSDLEYLDVSGFDTSNVINMDCMFYKCSSLKSLDLSSFETGIVDHMGGMFYGCTALSSLDLSSFDTRNVKEMYWMFEDCSSLSALDLKSFDTRNTLEMNQMFYNCSSLESLDLSNFKNTNTKRIDSMFYGCTNLKELDISNMNTSNVSQMYYMFYNCKSLKSLDLSSFDTSNAEEMFGMFEGCSSLASIDISSFDTSNVTKMQTMFRYCSSLTELDLTGFDTSNVTDFYSMFEGCTNLSYMNLSNFDTSKSNSTAYMFHNCPSLEPYINTAVAQNFSLNGNIEANIFIHPCETLAKAVLSGPDGDVEITDFSAKEADGTIKLTYPLNAAQGSEKIILKTYDKDNRQLILCNYTESLSCFSQVETSVHSYLKNVTYTQDYKDNDKLRAIVKALDNYCYAAEKYFNGAQNTIEGISDVTKENLPEELAPEFRTDVKLSLVLNSTTPVRIYTNSSNVKIDGVSVNPGISKYGKCYEIPGVSAHELCYKHTLTIDGTDYELRPLSYVYRVLNNSNAEPKLVDIAKATYVYANAAKAYIDKEYTEENCSDQVDVTVEEDI